MGTSLSGLTPATTFDGLLKVGDNDPLTATLKPISTGDGTDTMLELSTSALQIGGATGMYWDNTNKRLGVGTDAPSTTFEVYGAVRFRNNLNLNGTLSNSSTGEVNINNLGFFDAVSSNVGVGESTPTSRLHIKGSGASAGTTSLLVQNSAGTELFKIQDNYTTQITTDGGSSPALYLNTGSGREGGDGGLSIGSDTTKFNINSRFGNGVINASSSLFLTSSVGIGGNYTAASSGTARLFVKGSGATSATTALLVQNSAGTDMLRIMDGGADKVLRTSSAQIGSLEFAGANIGRGGGNPITFAGTNQIGVGVSTPDASAKLQVDSTTQGFLPPRMTTTERDAINMVGDPAVSTPATGLIIYNTTTNKAQCYNGTTWNDLF